MRPFLIACLMYTMWWSGNAVADSQQDRARDAYHKGEIMSLSEIRRNVHRNFEGEIIGTQFRPPSGGERRYIYKFRVLSSDGNVTTIDVDARTSRVIGVRGKR